MTDPAARRDPRAEEPERDYRISFGEVLAIDVLFCDLVPGRGNVSPFAVRIRGYKDGDLRDRIRTYVPLEEIEGPLIGAGALAGHVATPDKLVGNDRREIELLKRALLLRCIRAEGGRRKWQVEVRDDSDVEELVRTMRRVIEHAVPVLQEKGFSVGTSDVIALADRLRPFRGSSN